ncbi:uncharacterized protein [Amphiura filiformis]|uniref:uncharacterized protein n=1 Tax=Amphiura filiformis TaxID=82378 RepID=UPI003B21B3B7
MPSYMCKQYSYVVMVLLALIVAVYLPVVDAAHLAEKSTLFLCPGSNYYVRCYQQGPSFATDVTHPSFVVQNSNSIITKISYIAHYTASRSGTQGSKYEVVQGPLYNTDTSHGAVPSRIYYLILPNITKEDDGMMITCTTNVSTNPGRGVFEENRKTTVTVLKDCGPDNDLMSSTPSNIVYSSPSSSASSSATATTAAKITATASGSTAVTLDATARPGKINTYNGTMQTKDGVTIILLATFLAIAIIIILMLAYFLQKTRSRTINSTPGVSGHQNGQNGLYSIGEMTSMAEPDTKHQNAEMV